MKRFILLIGLIAVLALTPNVEAAARPVSEIFNVTYTGDQTCGTTCTSYVFLEMLQQPKQQDYINWSIQVGLNNTKSAAERVGNIDEFATYFSEENMGYELKIKTGETCINSSSYYENDTYAGEVEECKDILIDFTWENIASQFNQIGDVATIAILGRKEQTNNVKWSMRIGDIYIDPLWEGLWVFAPIIRNTGSNAALTAADHVAAWSLRPNEDFYLTDITIYTTTASPPAYEFGIQKDSGGYPDGAYISSTNATPPGLSNEWFNVSIPGILLNASENYWFVIEYAYGTISTSNYFRLNRNYMVSGSSITEPDYWAYPNNVNNTDYDYIYDIGSGWYESTGDYQQKILFFNSTKIYYGHAETSPTTYAIDAANEAVGQNFTPELDMNISDIIVGAKAESNGFYCLLNISLIDQGIPTSSWRDNIIANCSVGMSDINDNERSCTLPSVATINAGETYSIILTTNCTGGTGINVLYTGALYNKMDSFASSIAETATPGGKNHSYFSTTNDFSSKTVDARDDVGFYFIGNFSEPAAPVGNGYLATLLDTPSANTNFTKNEWNEFTINVTCTGGNCGNAFAYLDPKQHTVSGISHFVTQSSKDPKEVEKRETEEFLRHYYYAPGNYCSLGGLSR